MLQALRRARSGVVAQGIDLRLESLTAEGLPSRSLTKAILLPSGEPEGVRDGL